MVERMRPGEGLTHSGNTFQHWLHAKHGDVLVEGVIRRERMWGAAYPVLTDKWRGDLGAGPGRIHGMDRVTQ